MTPEWAASADLIARTALLQDRSLRQGHRLEQATQGGPVEHLGNGAEAEFVSVDSVLPAS